MFREGRQDAVRGDPSAERPEPPRVEAERRRASPPAEDVLLHDENHAVRLPLVERAVHGPFAHPVVQVDYHDNSRVATVGLEVSSEDALLLLYNIERHGQHVVQLVRNGFENTGVLASGPELTHEVGVHGVEDLVLSPRPRRFVREHLNEAVHEFPALRRRGAWVVVGICFLPGARGVVLEQLAVARIRRTGFRFVPTYVL